MITTAAVDNRWSVLEINGPVFTCLNSDLKRLHKIKPCIHLEKFVCREGSNHIVLGIQFGVKGFSASVIVQDSNMECLDV